MGEAAHQGKPCVTEFTVEERFTGYTRVMVSPLTGRKHQIRAHFFGIGHPIVGDTLYGDKSLQKTFPRLMLHALSIRLLLAPMGQEVAVASEIPVSFSEVLRSIRHPSR